jgi:hypothetical protein
MKLVKTHRNNSDDDVYHTTRECPYVTNDYLNAENANVPIAEYDECAWCADEIEYIGVRESPCPFCGESVRELPDHLPCEETP